MRMSPSNKRVLKCAWRTLALLTLAVGLGVSFGHGRQTAPPATPATAALLADGSFEIAAGPQSPWYLVEQAAIVADATAPAGKHVMRFQNGTPGMTSHAKQHIRLNGRVTPAVNVSVRVRMNDVGPGQSLSERPAVRIRFYDEHFIPVGDEMIGPWSGTLDWTQEQARFLTPPRSRIALITIGLHGGTGQADFDELIMTAADVNPSALPRGSVPAE